MAKLADVTISDAVSLTTGIDITRVAILDTEGTAEVDFVQTTSTSYVADLTTAGFTSTDALYKSVEAFFSNSQSARPRTVLFGSVEQGTTVIATYLQAQWDASDANKFGFLILPGVTRASISDFTDYSSFCNSKSAFCCVAEETLNTDLTEEDFVVQFYHQITGAVGILGDQFLMEKSIAYLSYHFKVASTTVINSDFSPNYNAQTLLTGVTGLDANDSSEADRQTAEDNNFNQYYNELVLQSVLRQGKVNSGKKIERIHTLQKYIPFDMNIRLQDYLLNDKPRESALPNFVAKLRAILDSYERASLIAITDAFTPQNAYQIIDAGITTISGDKYFFANVEINYDDNIIGIKISMRNVEVN